MYYIEQNWRTYAEPEKFDCIYDICYENHDYPPLIIYSAALYGVVSS